MMALSGSNPRREITEPNQTGTARVREGTYWYDTDVEKKRQNVDKLVAALAVDEDFKDLWGSPKTLRFVAEWYYDHSEVLPDHTLVAQAAKFFKEAGPYKVGSGGGALREAQLRTMQTAILNESMRLGLTMSPEEIDYMAKVAFELKYSADQLTNDLVKLADWKKVGAGTLTGVADQLKAVSARYLVRTPESAIQDWSKRIASGQATAEGFESFVRTQTKIALPFMSEYLDQGFAPSDLLQNSRAQIARSLGIDETTIDFTDPSYLALATVVGKDGNMRLANTAELRQNIRNDSRWASTDEARQTTTSMARLISEVFGRSVF